MFYRNTAPQWHLPAPTPLCLPRPPQIRPRPPQKASSCPTAPARSKNRALAVDSRRPYVPQPGDGTEPGNCRHGRFRPYSRANRTFVAAQHALGWVNAKRLFCAIRGASDVVGTCAAVHCQGSVVFFLFF